MVVRSMQGHTTGMGMAAGSTVVVEAMLSEKTNKVGSYLVVVAGPNLFG